MQKEEKTGATGLSVKQICGVCSLEPECIPWNLGDAHRGRLDGIIEHPPLLNEGEHLFQSGENLTTVYVVRTGAFKTYVFDSEEHEHVLGFSLPGELLGFDGVYPRVHGCNAVALQDSAVCALPYFDFASLMKRAAGLREQILQLASPGFSDRVIYSSLSTEARLARFLMDLSRRTSNHADSSVIFELPMPLLDIASFLRVTPQDIDRLFAYYMNEGIISLSASRMQLKDPDRLDQIARGK